MDWHSLLDHTPVILPLDQAGQQLTSRRRVIKLEKPALKLETKKKQYLYVKLRSPYKQAH